MTYAQAEINFAANFPHAGTVIAHHEQPTTAGMVEITSLGLALLDVCIRKIPDESVFEESIY